MIETDPRHEFDHPTEFCIHCGSAREQVVDRDLACIPEEDRPKVAAISHVIARRRWAELVSTIERYNKGGPPDAG